LERADTTGLKKMVLSDEKTVSGSNKSWIGGREGKKHGVVGAVGGTDT